MTPDKFVELPPEMRAFMLASEQVALEDEEGRRKEWLFQLTPPKGRPVR